MCSSCCGWPSSLCLLSLSAVSHACTVGVKTINILFVGSLRSPWQKKKVSNYKSRYTEARLLAGRNKQKNITCAWLGEEWAGPVLAALQSSLRQQKPLVLKTHTLEFPTLFSGRMLPKWQQAFSNNLPRELTTIPPSFICICSQRFSQGFKMAFTHLGKKILLFDSGKQLSLQHDVYTLNIAVATSVSLFSISMSLSPAQFMIYEPLTSPSPPAAAPPTSDDHSASTWEQVYDTCHSTEPEKVNIIWSQS